MRRNLLMAILALTACHSATVQGASPSSTTFHWLDPGKDSFLFGQIRAAFANELKPDDPERVKPVLPQLYKKISRIGVFGTSALVLIAERETPTSTYGDYFLAFTYDLNNNKKVPLDQGFMVWKFRRFVRFEPSSMPDIVFTYLSCTECEAEHLLGSFRFDSANGEWKIRKWTEKDDAIMIGSDTVVGSEEGEYYYDCLFKFADLNGDGFDDLVVRCVAIGEQGKILDDTTTIYAVQHGQPQTAVVKEPKQLTTLWEKLCANVKKSKLCPPK